MKKTALRTATALFLILFCCSPQLPAADWPQFRGPNHDSTTPERISTVWPAGGPRVLWKVPLTGGFSSFSVGGGKAFTLVRRIIEGADLEVCVALDAANGRELWAVPLAVAKYDKGGDNGASDNNGGDGPRSTPTVDEGKVYAFSSRLVLYCLDAASGKEVWKKDLVAEHAGRLITWQNAASPLVDGEMLFVAGGGLGQALLGINKRDGRVVWKGQDDLMTHSTPLAASILGLRQVIFFTQRGLVALSPQTGAVLWRQPFRYNVSTAMTPIVAGDIVYCSAGYGIGSGAYKISRAGNGFSSQELWFKPASVFNNHWSTPVSRDGYLYGLFGFKEFGSCPMKCIELATGNVMWSREGFGPGGTILAGGYVLVLGDAGQLVLVRATPVAYSEVARARVLTGKCWSTPAVSGGRIFARSTREGVCVDVSPQVSEVRER